MPEHTTALVTGASSGIGRELARLLAQQGHHVALVARRHDELEALAHELGSRHDVRCRVVTADLADADAPRRILAALYARRITVDVLVNAAAFGTHGPFARSDLDTERRLLQVNVGALMELTHRCLPAMLQRGRGRILNVASTAAFQAGPFMAGYYASKAWVLSFGEALAEELASSGVTVTTLCPGPTRTEFQAKAGIADLPIGRAARIADAASVAQNGFAGMMAGRRLVVPGLANRLHVQGLRLAPRRLVTAIVRRLQQRRTPRPI